MKQASSRKWLLLGALTLGVLLGVGLHAWHSDPRVLTGAADDVLVPLLAFADPPWNEGAGLTIDGTREGRLPYAWQPQARAQLKLQVAEPASWMGAVVSWTGEAPPQATLLLDSESVALTAAEDGESLAWRGVPLEAAHASVEARPGAGIAEVQLLDAEAPVWLLAPRARADWDLELLATYGATSVARLPMAGPVPSTARTLVVSNGELTTARVTELRAYVRAGGSLLELGPHSAICGPPAANTERAAEGFVLEGAAGSGTRWFSELAVSATCERAALGCEGLEVQVSARRPTQPASALVLPVVVSRVLGKGRCTRWLGDLALAIRDLRQGDASRGDARSGSDAAHKPADLFTARAFMPGDFAVPSADRLGRLLARQLTARPGLDVLVAPLPAAAPGLVVYSADQDFVPAAGELARSAAAAPAGMTLTLTAADIGGKPDIEYPEAKLPMLEAADVDQLASRGHSVGIHPNLVDVDIPRYGAVIAQHAQRFLDTYGRPPLIVRNHHLIWLGYVDMAELMARVGLTLDLDYVSAHSSGRIDPGFMTGSGLPMRFVDEHGRLLPIYQQATQLDDSALIDERPEALQDLSVKLAALLEVGKREHVPIHVLHHSHWWHRTAGRLQTALIEHAHRLGLPIWGEGQWLRFTQARRATVLRSQGQSFEVIVAADEVTLWVEGAASVRVDGQRRSLSRVEDPAGSYGLLQLTPGAHRVEP